MIRPLLTLALLTSPLAMAGCSDKLLSAVGSVVPKVKVTGTVYAPATQVAVVAAGGLNWRIAARSDEKGVSGAKVSFGALAASFVPLGSAQTTTSGGYTIEVPPGSDYAVTATFKAKDGSTVTLSGLTTVSTSGGSFNLDAAHNLVASKLLSLGVKKLDATQLEKAYSQMTEDLTKVSSVPTPTSQSAAASEFDKAASDSLKTLVEDMAK
jgi:hypothetical protein